MPLYNNKPVKLTPIPIDIADTTKVFKIRFTGEIFETYDEYLERIDFYRQSKFVCQYTGKSGFTFESALAHEIETKKEIWNKIPSQFVPLILAEIQFSQCKISELVNKIYDKLQSTQLTHSSNANSNTNPESETEISNSNQSKKKSPKKPVVKKSLIRTVIRIVSHQHNFKNAPWILHNSFAQKYGIPTELPSDLQTLISEKLNKSKTGKKSKSRKPKQKPSAKGDGDAKDNKKSDSMISEFLIDSNSNSKNLKYPLDDQMLLFYNKMSDEQITKFDAFWSNSVSKIGIVNHSQIQTENASNLAFYDFNRIYDQNPNANDDSEKNLSLTKHRQINNLFSEVWKFWTFSLIYGESLKLSPFPISFLLDALCYDKRCSLLDELHCSLLEVLRLHCVTFIADKEEQKKQEKLRQKQRAKNARKAARRKRKLRERRAAKEAEAQRKKSEGGDDDNGSDATKSESEMDEDSDDESEEFDSEETEDTEDEQDDDDDDDEEEDMSENDEGEGDEEEIPLVFTDESTAITSFKLEILREYLRFRCTEKEQQMSEEKKMDIDGDDGNDDDDENENEDEDESENESENEREVLLPEFDYFLSDEIWENLSNIRSFTHLSIESKLQILNILFNDCMQSNVLKQWNEQKIETYQQFKKQEIKEIDDEFSKFVKHERKILSQLRNEILEQKRSLKPNAKSKANSRANSKSNTNSPTNQENKSKVSNKSKSNSKSISITATNQKSKSVDSISEMENSLKLKRDAFLAKKGLKAMENISKKWNLLSECQTFFSELGSDRFYNKYFWNRYSDGRIFIFHPNQRYHFIGNQSEVKSAAITKECLGLVDGENGIRCFDEWDAIRDGESKEIETEMDGNQSKFCWSFISKTSEFHRLLAVLDDRGVREKELLLHLRAFEKEIVGSMRMVGNDDYEQNVEGDDANDDASSSEIGVRRSKRANKGIHTQKGQKMFEYVNKGFLCYRNSYSRTR